MTVTRNENLYFYVKGMRSMAEQLKGRICRICVNSVRRACAQTSLNNAACFALLVVCFEERRVDVEALAMQALLCTLSSPSNQIDECRTPSHLRYLCTIETLVNASSPLEPCTACPDSNYAFRMPDMP